MVDSWVVNSVVVAIVDVNSDVVDMLLGDVDDIVDGIVVVSG